jgi:hypothetical protein
VVDTAGQFQTTRVLHSVPEKVRQEKWPLFRTDRVIDIDFRTVEITGQ